jgi:hypothetical protein
VTGELGDAVGAAAVPALSLCCCPGSAAFWCCCAACCTIWPPCQGGQPPPAPLAAARRSRPPPMQTIACPPACACLVTFNRLLAVLLPPAGPAVLWAQQLPLRQPRRVSHSRLGQQRRRRVHHLCRLLQLLRLPALLQARGRLIACCVCGRRSAQPRGQWCRAWGLCWATPDGRGGASASAAAMSGTQAVRCCRHLTKRSLLPVLVQPAAALPARHQADQAAAAAQ